MSPEGAPSPPEFFRELLSTGASGFSFDLDEPSLSALGIFLAELDRWRRAMDLTGPLSGEELASHTQESIFGASFLPEGATVLDIGSGAGFPGVPIAIVRPDLAITALEPRAKRAEFLRHAARAVPVPNLRVLEARLDTTGTESWDAATVRAVGELPETLGPASFLKPGGALLAWTTKPQDLASKLAPRFQLERVEPVPGTRRRVIALYRKAAAPRSRQTPEEAMFPVERSG